MTNPKSQRSSQVRLGEYFSFDEMTHTAQAGLQDENRKLGKMYVYNGCRLVQQLLDPIRSALGPVRVTSGFRSLRLNGVVGGAPNSDHLTFSAADVNVVGMDAEEVFAWARTRSPSELPFKQLILEKGKNSTWLHISIDEEGVEPRRQVLTLYPQ